MENIIFSCPKCGKEYQSKNAWCSHKGKCGKPKTGKWLEAMHNRQGKKLNKIKICFTCQFCNETFLDKNVEYKTQHENHCKMNPNAKKYKGHPHTDDFKKKISDVAKRNNFGGWHTSKSIDYNGIKLDSSYELILAQDLDENNIKWEKPKPLYWKLNDSEHRYYPDFYLPEFNIYIDTKNDFLINNVNPRFGITDVEKIRLVETQNNVMILILDKDNLSWQCLLRSLSGR